MTPQLTDAQKTVEIAEYALSMLTTLQPEVRQTFYQRWTVTLPKLENGMQGAQRRALHYRKHINCGLVTTGNPDTPRIVLTKLGRALVDLMKKDKRLRTWET